MKKRKDNEVIVIHQPRHSICSIVLMDSSYPLEKEVHEGIFKLGEVSDIIFIFSSTYFPKNTSMIDKDKFCTIYGGTAWIEQGLSVSVGETLLKVIKYCKHIFNSHTEYTFLMCSGFSIAEKIIPNLMKVALSGIIKPIYSCERLGAERMYDIYKKRGSKEENKGGGDVIKGIIKKITSRITETGYDCRYCTWSCNSEIMFVKIGILNRVLDIIDGDSGDRFLEIIRSFTTPNIKDILCNLFKLSGIVNINYNLEDLEVEKL